MPTPYEIIHECVEKYADVKRDPDVNEFFNYPSVLKFKRLPLLYKRINIISPEIYANIRKCIEDLTYEYKQKEEEAHKKRKVPPI